MAQQWFLHPFVAEYVGRTLVDLRFIGLGPVCGAERWEATLAGSRNLVMTPVRDADLQVAVDCVLSGDPEGHEFTCSGIFAFRGASDARWDIMGPAGAFFSQQASVIRETLALDRHRPDRHDA